MNTGIIGNLSIFAILFLGLVQFQNGVITIGDYIMVVSYVTSFYPRLLELIYEIRHLSIATVDLEKYFKIFEEETEVLDPIHPINRKKIKGKIEFKNVSFIYPDNKNKALNNFSISIKPGQSIALVGKSGVGKTTVSKLILRYYDIQQGEILVDDINIKKYNKSKLRSFIGVVPQEPILFNDTILYNIAYSKNKATKKQVVAASKAAHLHDFIMSLPKKYNTIVGERGVKLSGGQRQRLAIARVILADPDIVLFDEATSQLDSISEKLIREALRYVCKNKTTIIIAHRLSTISWVNKILVLDKGKIIESGTHQKLLKDKKSLYNQFWQLQSDQVSEEIDL
jgi:subfamily B ATP-binding cassette protein MsbA